MSSPIVDKIHELLVEYLRGKRTLQQFDETFIRLAWDVAGPLDTEAAELRGEILLLLAEYTAGHRSESEIKRLLRGIARESALT